MAWISGSLSAGYIPEHEQAVKAVLQKAEEAIKNAAAEAGFDSICVNHAVANGSGWLSVSLSKSTPCSEWGSSAGPATCAG